MKTLAAEPYNKILATAEQLIYDNGIHAASMDLLVKSSGVARKTIYRYFSTKDEVAAAALRARDLRWMQWFCDETDKAASPRLRVIQMFDTLTSWFNTPGFRGCAFINTAGEVGDAESPIRLISKLHKHKLLAYAKQLCEQAECPDPAALAKQMLILMDGAITVARVTGDLEAAQSAKVVAHILLEKSGI